MQSTVGADQDGGAGGDGRELRGDDGGEIRWFRYVRQEDRAAFEAQGWVFAADLGPVHGRYSVLMELQGRPKKADDDPTPEG